MILKGYMFAIFYGIACLFIAHLLLKFGWPKTFTRKFVHIFIGLEWLILYNFHGSSIHFFIVCLIFLTLVSFSHFTDRFHMISSDTDRTPGTVYYCISMSIMAFISLFAKNTIVSFGVAVFCTSFGDGLAGVLGRSVNKHNPKVFKDKTLVGIVANFVASFISALVFALVYDFDNILIYSFAIAVIAVFAELFAKKGLDNITLPLSVFALSLFIRNVQNSYAYILPILITPLMIQISLEKKWLTVGGVLSALALDVAVSLAFGNFGFILILVLLVCGTLLDKVKKNTTNNKFKQKPRTSFQVLANSFAAIICSVLFVFLKNEVLLVAFCASVTEAFADTVASSLGSISKNTVDIFKFKKCKRGLSGGVSFIGTLGAFLASILMSSITFILTSISFTEAIFIFLVSFIGVFIDTFFGSVFQAKYFCTKCGETGEEKLCCGTIANKTSGSPLFTNELVNLISTILTAALAVVGYVIFI